MLKFLKPRTVRRAIRRDREFRPVKIQRLPGGHVRYSDSLGLVREIDHDQLLAARKAVKRGAALLDRYVPGWSHHIWRDSLRLDSCAICVCGQVANALTKRSFAPLVGGYAYADPSWYAPGERRWDHVWDWMYAEEVKAGRMDPNRSTAYATACGFLYHDGEPYLTNVAGDQKYSYPALEVEWHRLLERRHAPTVETVAA